MIIWIVFFLIVLWVNLPSIIQKQLADKFANGDYSSSDCPIKLIEWFRLYPLKKCILVLLWLLSLYPSVRGCILVWMKNEKEFLEITLFFIFITVLTAYPIWRYVRRPYHCAIVLNHFFSKDELENKLRNEKFERVKFENPALRAEYMFASRNWLVINGILYEKRYMKNFQYIYSGKARGVWISYYNDKGLALPFLCIGGRDGEIEKTMNKVMGKQAKWD